MSKQKRISIVATSFHKKHVEVMLVEARKACRDVNLTIVNVLWVPGSLETPLALKRELMSKKVDGGVVLGIIERGETKHGLVMGMAVISAILKIQLATGKPVGVGILGPEITPNQIKPRLKPYAKGAVLAALAMLE